MIIIIPLLLGTEVNQSLDPLYFAAIGQQLIVHINSFPGDDLMLISYQPWQYVYVPSFPSAYHTNNTIPYDVNLVMNDRSL